MDDKSVLGRESVQGMGDVNVRIYLLKDVPVLILYPGLLVYTFLRRKC